MNIEQIKKDWSDHCKEYGFKPLYSEIKTDSGVVLDLFTKEGGKILNRLNLASDSKVLLCDHNFYKLFTTFYEKLMEQK